MNKLSLLFYILLREKPYQKPLQFPENSTSPGGPRNVHVYNNRKKALNNFKKHPTTEKLNIYKREHASARRVFRENMKNTWKNYVSKLNDQQNSKSKLNDQQNLGYDSQKLLERANQMALDI